MNLSFSDDLPKILKQKTFKLSEMVVSWRYIIISDTGLEKAYLFQCIDAIKLELTYQTFLNFNKNESNKEFQSNFKIVYVQDGIVDLSKFILETWKAKSNFKVIRDGDE